MKLDKIINLARNGELKGLSEVDKTDEVITGYINLAMIALYGRFQLDTEEAVISLRDHKTMYRLDGTDPDVKIRNATGQEVPVPEDDVMTIVEAFDEKGPIPINDEDNDYSIHTVAYNMLQVPVTATGNFISIVYKKAPKYVSRLEELEGGGAEEEDVITDLINGGTADTVFGQYANINIPKALLEPLLHYVGYRAHGSLNGSIEAENNTHLMRFEKACDDVRKLSLVPLDNTARPVTRKGFV